MSNKCATKGPGVLDLVNKTIKLPTIPTVMLKLNEVAENPESSAEDVADVITQDPSIATNILRIVNSAYYGLQVRVSSVQLAVSIMGFATTRKVALKAAIFSVFGKKREDIPGFSPEAFWAHANYTGVAARVLGENCETFSGMDNEDLFIAGLLHDIGRIILFEKAPDAFAECMKLVNGGGKSLLEAEKEVFGFMHSDVGSVLAIKWFLPEDLTIAIRYHHNPEKDPFSQSTSNLVHVADSLAWAGEYGSCQDVDPPIFKDDALEKLGLDQEKLTKIQERTKELFSQMEKLW